MPIPPVSMISHARPPYSTTVETRSRVTPAVGSTMLIRRPASQLNSDDLPTFGRPTIATIGRATTEPQQGTNHRGTETQSRPERIVEDGRPSCLENTLFGLLC